jgi:hypothetical protein
VYAGNFFASLKILKKGVGSGVGAGSGCISQRYGSADPFPHQNVTDPQHCRKYMPLNVLFFARGAEAEYPAKSFKIKATLEM